MRNDYYILATEKTIIDRFHICTWELPSDSSCIEFGLEFSPATFKDNKNTIGFYLAIPDVRPNDSVTCLLDNLSDSQNGRFIFNDIVTGMDNIGEDARDGKIIKFENRENLTLLPCTIIVEDGIICLKLKKPEKSEGSLYCRILVKYEKRGIAIKKKGITQTTYIYDFKINEKRNLPQQVYELKKSQSLKICHIRKLFCLHAMPDNFNFSFIDTSKLKNIRKLESSAFQRYLPQISGIRKDCYNIMFLKDEAKDDNDSYSLFTVCTEETIGSKQIALAVGANILCTLLFAIYSLKLNNPMKWYLHIPWEYWAATGIVVVLGLYLLIPLKRLRK